MRLKIILPYLLGKNFNIGKLLFCIIIAGCSGADDSVINDNYYPGINPDDYIPKISFSNLDAVNIANQSNYNLEGVCSQTVREISVLLNSKEYSVPCLNDKWMLTENLEELVEGSFSVEIKTVDIFGKEAKSNITLIKDITPPIDPTSITRIAPVENLSDKNVLDFQANNILGDYVVLYYDENCSLEYSEKLVSSDPELFLGVLAREGSNKFSVRVRDLAKNYSACISSTEYILDSIDPLNPSGIIMTSPGNGEISVDNTPEFNYLVQDELGSILKIYKDAFCLNEIGQGEINSEGVKIDNISLALDGTDKGVNNFYGKVEDLALNESDCTDLNLSYELGATGLASLNKISMVGLNVSTDLISLENGVEVFLNEVQIGGILNSGDTLNFNSSQGDQIKCTGPCYVVSEGSGTAAWASEAYAGKSFSTYVSRDGENEPRIYVAIFQDETSIDLTQDGSVIKTLTGDKGDIVLFEETLLNKSVQIFGNKKIVAYFVSRVNGGTSVYDQDARVLTPAAKEVIGLTGYITSIEDDTEVFSYRNNGTNYTDLDLDLDQTRNTGGTNYGRFSVYSKSDKPVSITQTADGNGNNSTQSLPVSMMSTNYGLSRDASYVSFSSLAAGSVDVINPAGAVINTVFFSRTGVNPNTPYLIRYLLDPNYPTSPTSHPIPAGTRFECSVPCFAVYDDIETNLSDETLMMGYSP